MQGEAFNFSPETQVQVIDIVREIQRVMGRADLEPVILDQVRAEIRDQYLDASKARRVLQWKPAFTLEQGLTATVAWYRAFFGPRSDADAQ